MLKCLFLIRIGRLKMLKRFFPNAARTEMTMSINVLQVHKLTRGQKSQSTYLAPGTLPKYHKYNWMNVSSNLHNFAFTTKAEEKNRVHFIYRFGTFFQ